MAHVQDIEIPDAAARVARAKDELSDIHDEKMVLNMGPSHPATHGVLRIVLELDGEVITKADPDVGYLHRGDEKIAENMTYTQFIPYTDRLDYLAPLANNVAYALAVEKLLGIDDKLPPRCQYIRVMCAELARISAHLLGLGAFAMDTGAVTVFLLTFTEREKIYDLAEAASGARLTTSYTRIGGLSRDVPPTWVAMVRKFLKEFEVALGEAETLLTRNRIWVDRLRDLGVISKEMAIDYGLSGPNLRGSGVEYDRRKKAPYLCYKDLSFDIPTGSVGDCYDRYLVRMEEMRQSNRIIKQCIDWLRKNPGPVIAENHKAVSPKREAMKENMEELIHHFKLFTEGMHVPAGEAYAAVEHPKGEFGIYLVSDGANKPYRMKIRAPGFAHMAALDEMARGHMIADVVAIIGTQDIVFGEVDR